MTSIYCAACQRYHPRHRLTQAWPEQEARRKDAILSGLILVAQIIVIGTILALADPFAHAIR